MVLQNTHCHSQFVDTYIVVVTLDSGESCQLFGTLKDVVAYSFETFGCRSRRKVTSPEGVNVGSIGEKVVCFDSQLDFIFLNFVFDSLNVARRC